MKTIGALIFDGFELLDVFGPMEMFGMLKDDYELHLVADNVGAVKSNQGLSAMATLSIGERTDFDILFVPGGAGTRREVNNEKLLNWLIAADEVSQYTLSVCTGSALLAKAGVLDGKKATTNKMAIDWVLSQGRNTDWQRQARWVEDGKYFTSSGVSAGMDMSLAVIAKMHGLERAEQVAIWCEYQWHKDSNWDPFAKIHGLI